MNRILRATTALLAGLLPFQAQAALHLATGVDFVQAPSATAFNINDVNNGNNPSFPGWYRCAFFRSTAAAGAAPSIFSSGTSYSAAGGINLFATSTGGSGMNYSLGGVFVTTGISDYVLNLTDGLPRIMCIQGEPDALLNGRTSSIRFYTAILGGGARLSGGYSVNGAFSLTSVTGMKFGGQAGNTTQGMIGDYYAAWGGQGMLSLATISNIAQGILPATAISAQGLPALDYNYDFRLAANGNPTIGSTASGSITDLSANGNNAPISGVPTWVADPVYASAQIGINEPPPVTAVRPNGVTPINLTGEYQGTPPTGVDIQVEYQGVNFQSLGPQLIGSTSLTVGNVKGLVPGMQVTIPSYASTSNPPVISTLTPPIVTTSPSGAALTATTLTIPAGVTAPVVGQGFSISTNFYNVTAVSGTTVTFSPAVSTTALAAGGAITFNGLIGLTNGGLTAALPNAVQFVAAGGQYNRLMTTTGTASGTNVVQIPTSVLLKVGSAAPYLPGIVPAGCYVASITGTTATLSNYTGGGCILTGAITAGTLLDFGAQQVISAWTALPSPSIGSGVWSATLPNLAMGAQRLLRVREAGLPTISASTQQAIGVGYTIVAGGQSLEYQMILSGVTTGVPTLYAPYVSYNNQNGFCNATINPGSGMQGLENMLAAAFPYTPVQIVPVALSNTELLPDTARYPAVASGAGNTLGSTSVTVASTLSNPNAFGRSSQLAAGTIFEPSTYFSTGAFSTALAGTTFTIPAPGLLATIPAGTTINTNYQWWLDTVQPNNLYTVAKRGVSLCGNDASVVEWYQGQAEELNGTTRALYQAGLSAFAQRWAADYNRTLTTLPLLVDIAGPYIGTGDSYNLETRLGQLAYVNSYSPGMLGSNEGITVAINNGGVHPLTGPWTYMEGIRQGQSATWALTKGSVPRAYGPTITHASVSGQTVRLYMSHQGGSALALWDPSAIVDGFVVTDATGTVPIIGQSVGPNWLDLYFGRPFNGNPSIAYALNSTISTVINLATNPFTTTAGSFVYTLAVPGHNLHAGDHFNFENAFFNNTFGGLSTSVSAAFPGIVTVTSVIDANTITFTLPTAAVSTGTNGGSNWRVRSTHWLWDNSTPAFGLADPVTPGNGPLPALLTPVQPEVWLTKRRAT